VTLEFIGLRLGITPTHALSPCAQVLRVTHTEFIRHVMSMGFDCANGNKKFFCDFACCRFVRMWRRISHAMDRKEGIAHPSLLFSLHPGKVYPVDRH
jgi:hypothetical protein